VNKNELRSVMALHNETNEVLAEVLGISTKSVSSKLNSKTEFLQGEIATIARHYKLTDEQIVKIFFNREVSC